VISLSAVGSTAISEKEAESNTNGVTDLLSDGPDHYQILSVQMFLTPGWKLLKLVMFLRYRDLKTMSSFSEHTTCISLGIT
jgi:hypothetical protein